MIELLKEVIELLDYSKKLEEIKNYKTELVEYLKQNGCNKEIIAYTEKINTKNYLDSINELKKVELFINSTFSEAYANILADKNRTKLSVLKSLLLTYESGDLDSLIEHISNDNSLNDYSCPECKYTGELVVSKGNSICPSCGLCVYENSELVVQDARCFTLDQRLTKSRYGGGILDFGNQTLIDFANRDAQGKKLSPLATNNAYRLRKWHSRTGMNSSTARSKMSLGFSLSKYESAIPKKIIIELAKKICYKCKEKDIIRGRGFEIIAAASIYSAVRVLKYPLSLKKIISLADNSGVTPGIIQSTVMILDQAKVYEELKIKLALQVIPIGEICSTLNLTEHETLVVDKLMTKLNTKNLNSGKDPMGFLGAVMYILFRGTGTPLTQRTIASVVSVTEVTIRNRYKELCKKDNIRTLIESYKSLL
ncbi:Transcription initiation factor IIB [Candidatus Tiddalikarchaeum anstoanum]|nr:Transcription initiation factor IIB [Candidatus Tiddalikarchaeum anstoanum]